MEIDGKICKLCYAFGKIHPVGFGQWWWASEVVEGAFAPDPLPLQGLRQREMKMPQQQICRIRWKMAVGGTNTRLLPSREYISQLPTMLLHPAVQNL